VFLFDEPLSNLDAKLRAATRLEIQKLHRELGITSLFVTHDQVEAMTLAQRMLNLLPGRAEGERLHVGGITLALPAPAPRDGDVILGLRPEHAAPGEGWPLTVDVVEMLGAERLVYGRLGDAPFTLRIDGTAPAPAPGQVLPITAAADRLHWFDATTRRRL
jgi:sn-glycerol 3-phosphate transport system ATP-binding protein